MNNACLVRKAGHHDSARILEIHNTSQSRQGNQNQDLIPWEKHYSWFKHEYLENTANACFVLDYGNNIIGYCRLDSRNDRYIVSIAIDPAYHGQGLATFLLDESLRQLNPDKIILATVKKDNLVAVKLFTKNGFSHVATDEAFFHFEKEYGTEESRRQYREKSPDLIHPLPEILRIEPASACNFKCIHCPTGLGLNESLGVMSMQTFEAILEKLENLQFQVIALYHGGEPMLNKNLCLMAKRLRPFAKMIKTVTNGSRLNDASIKQLLDSGLDMIEVSLDGNSPEENDAIRVGSHFHKIAEQVVALIRKRNILGLDKPKIYISHTQIPKTREELNRIDIPEFLKTAFRDVVSDIEYKPTYSLIWPGMDIVHLVGIPDRNYCNHVALSLTVRWNGDVVPCCYDLVNEMVMGNLLRQRLEEIWNGEKYQKLRADILNYRPPKLCQNCTVLNPGRYMIEQELQNYISTVK